MKNDRFEYDSKGRLARCIFDNGNYIHIFERYEDGTIEKETIYKNGKLYEVTYRDREERMLLFEMVECNRYTIFAYDENYDKFRPSHEFTYKNDELIEETHYGKTVFGILAENYA